MANHEATIAVLAQARDEARVERDAARAENIELHNRLVELSLRVSTEGQGTRQMSLACKTLHEEVERLRGEKCKCGADE